MLPVLPVVFLSGSGYGKATRRPYLVVAGLTLSFSVFTLLGTLTLDALPLPKDIVHWGGLILLVLLGIGMMIPRVEDLLEYPFRWIPQRRVTPDRGGFVLGLALGAVYVPCAGPVLAAITVAGATGRISWRIVALTAAFAIGTAVPLLVFALAGRGITERLRAFRRRQRQIRIGAGVLVVGLAVALTFNVTDAIQRAIPDYTNGLNRASGTDQKVARAVRAQPVQGLTSCAEEFERGATGLANCGAAPEISGITHWLDTPGGAPVSLAGLRGKVVLVDFWAYSCINCQRAIPHVEAWYSHYAADGFEVIGVHAPEYSFEQVTSNVQAGIKRLGITYPVAQDNRYATWNAYGNSSWPADYLIDSTGTIRFVSAGEGDYGGTESDIRQLLMAAHPGITLPAATDVPDRTPTDPQQTPETYLDSTKAGNFAGGQLIPGVHTYSYPPDIRHDLFALNGTWKVGSESLTAVRNAAVEIRFDASDVYLDVGGTGTITATLDGTVKAYAVKGPPDIYQLIGTEGLGTGLLRVTLSPGLQAYSFTFG